MDDAVEEIHIFPFQGAHFTDPEPAAEADKKTGVHAGRVVYKVAYQHLLFPDREHRRLVFPLDLLREPYIQYNIVDPPALLAEADDHFQDYQDTF